MTQDGIIEMAKEAGLKKATAPSGTVGDYFWGTPHQIEAFAKLVAAKEREACEKACEEERNDPDDQFKNYEDTHTDGWIDGCNSCISAIRARGEA